MEMFLAFLSSSIPLGVPLLYGSVGEIVTEKSGHLNLGIPGIMYVGSISGVIGAFFYEMACDAAGVALVPALAILIPLLCSIIGSVLMGLIYSFLTVTLRANQNVTGLAFAMKPPIRSTTPCSILQKCLSKTECAVCGIFMRSVIRWAAVLWSALPIRQQRIWQRISNSSRRFSLKCAASARSSLIRIRSLRMSLQAPWS